MPSAAITDVKNRLSHYLRLVARGETVTVLDRGKPVARIVGVVEVDEHLQRLAAEGVADLPTRKLPADFWTRPLPKSSRSVVQALLEEREESL